MSGLLLFFFPERYRTHSIHCIAAEHCHHCHNHQWGLEDFAHPSTYIIDYTEGRYGGGGAFGLYDMNYIASQLYPADKQTMTMIMTAEGLQMRKRRGREVLVICLYIAQTVKPDEAG